MQQGFNVNLLLKPEIQLRYNDICMKLKSLFGDSIIFIIMQIKI